MSASDKFTAIFEYEKGTKNTFKYAEKPEPGQPPRIGSLYVQKWAFGTDNPPQGLRVTVERADGNGKQGKESP
jgi:hypothetical protein